jgi:hypothetical protein
VRVWGRNEMAEGGWCAVGAYNQRGAWSMVVSVYIDHGEG